LTGAPSKWFNCSRDTETERGREKKDKENKGGEVEDKAYEESKKGEEKTGKCWNPAQNGKRGSTTETEGQKQRKVTKTKRQCNKNLNRNGIGKK
jgi:hypothetical protein